MSFVAGSITGTLGLDTDPFAKGMLRAESIMRIFPGSVQNFLASPLLGIIGVTKQVTSALVGMFNDAAAHADKLGDMATNIGVSVEALSGLSLVSRQAGGNLEMTADAYKFLSKNANEAAEAIAGNKSNSALAAFDAIGVSAVDQYGRIKPLQQLMLEVADGIARLDERQRVPIAMELMGRGGTQMIATLSQGSEKIQEQIDRYHRWGAVVTGESVRTADVWQDSMGDISIAWEGVKNRLGERMRIVLLPELEKLLGWIDANQDKISGWVQSVVEQIKSLVQYIRELIAEAGKWKTAATGGGAIAAGGTGLLAGITLSRGMAMGAGAGGGAAAMRSPGLAGPLLVGGAAAALEAKSGGDLGDVITTGVASGLGFAGGAIGTASYGILASTGVGLLAAAGFGGLAHLTNKMHRGYKEAAEIDRSIAEFHRLNPIQPPTPEHLAAVRGLGDPRDVLFRGREGKLSLAGISASVTPGREGFGDLFNFVRLINSQLDQFPTRLRDTLRALSDLTQQARDLIDALQDAGQSGSTPSTSSGQAGSTERPVFNFHGDFRLPSFDPKLAAAEIAAVLTPRLRETFEEQKRALTGAAMATAIAGGF